MRDDRPSGALTVSFVVRFWLDDAAPTRRVWRARIIEARSGKSRFVNSPTAAFRYLAQRLRGAAGSRSGGTGSPAAPIPGSQP